MKIHCELCGKSYAPDDTFASLAATLRKARMTHGYLTCAKCGKNATFDLKRMTIIDERKLAQPEPHFMCPISGCWGLALPKKRGKGYSCAECGGAWTDPRALFAAITTIVKRYRHRRRVYVKTTRGWKPTPVEKQPDDWQDLVGEREKVESPPTPARRKR